MTRRFAAVIVASILCCGRLDSQNVAPASVVVMTSASLETKQAFTILLPANYDTSTRRYPVLYLLHGGGQDHTAFAARTWFSSLASRDMIVARLVRQVNRNWNREVL